MTRTKKPYQRTKQVEKETSRKILRSRLTQDIAKFLYWSDASFDDLASLYDTVKQAYPNLGTIDLKELK